MDVEQIIAGMSLKEKIAQLTQLPVRPGKKEAFEELSNILKTECIGSVILAGSALAGGEEYKGISLDEINELQRIAMETYGIPLIFGHDVIHGYNITWPIPLAMAATFNRELVEQSYRCIAEEAKNGGINWAFAPMMDISRDARWGRVIEGSGEDPYLAGEMAVAAIKGFQGREDTLFMAACAKHYIGYGASEGGRDYHKAEISDYTMRNYYLHPFKKAVQNNVATVMNSFNEVSGQPTASSRYLLTEVLRDELGFEGFVVSDWGAINQLVRQGVAADAKEASALAINAGLDMDMSEKNYLQHLYDCVLDGTVSEEAIETSVRRILEIKDKLGLFENPYFLKKDIFFEQHREIAKEAAMESIVLLKNNHALPLKKEEKIVIIGPMTEEKRDILGSWAPDLDLSETVTIFDGIKAFTENIIAYDPVTTNSIHMSSIYECDTILLSLGESFRVNGEANSVVDIEINPMQKELIAFARKSRKKVVALLSYGRPIALESVINDFDAVLYLWHSGSQTGNAVAEILFGSCSPCGKLPITMPRTVGQIPIYYNCPPSGRDVDGYYNGETGIYKNYHDATGKPMYPFGFGLSYSKFKYDNMAVEHKSISLDRVLSGEKFMVSIDITNAGEYPAKEVVQCYVRDCVSSMTRPIKELKGFEKIYLEKGETKTVTFRLGYDELGFYVQNKEFCMEKGLFRVYVGRDCLVEEYIEICVN